LATGCIAGSKAKPAAAYRSGCPADKIQVVKQERHDLVLDVCGVHEDWRWHAFNGWEYVGPATTQPVKQAALADLDGDGVEDRQDACRDVPGAPSPDAKANGCPARKDGDGDGVFDDADACPTAKGKAHPDAKKSGCPVETDADGDGVLDKDDACKDKPGSADGPKPGCPLDKDSDGVADADDGCVEVAGPADNKGCPPDKDSDGVVDEKDACPEVAGVASDAADKNGCPETPKGKKDKKKEKKGEGKDAKAGEGKDAKAGEGKAPESKSP
jgi:hypothetical protein